MIYSSKALGEGGLPRRTSGAPRNDGQAKQTQHWCNHLHEFAGVCEQQYRHHGPIGSNTQAFRFANAAELAS